LINYNAKDFTKKRRNGTYNRFYWLRVLIKYSNHLTNPTLFTKKNLITWIGFSRKLCCLTWILDRVSIRSATVDHLYVLLFSLQDFNLDPRTPDKKKKKKSTKRTSFSDTRSESLSPQPQTPVLPSLSAPCTCRPAVQFAQLYLPPRRRCGDTRGCNITVLLSPLLAVNCEQSGSRCALCTKVFAYGANLVQHMKTHHQQAAAVKAEEEEEKDLVKILAVPTMTSYGILMF
jgi:hypothetical protein